MLTRSCVLFLPSQGSRLSCGMKALTMTTAKTSGVIYVSPRCTPWAGVLQAANPSYLQKVSHPPTRVAAFHPDVSAVRWLVENHRRPLCALFFSAGIQHKYSNWKAFLVKRLTGAKTLPPDFSTKVGLKTRKINARLWLCYAATDTQEPLRCVCGREEKVLGHYLGEQCEDNLKFFVLARLQTCSKYSHVCDHWHNSSQ